jgi:hypothetical protein
MSSKSAIVIHSYLPDKDGHGGNHRSLQVRNELLKDFGSKLVSFNVDGVSASDVIGHRLILAAVRMLPYLKRFRLRAWLRLVAASSILQKLNVCGFDRVFVEQSPNQSIYFSAAVALMRIDYTLLPHNVEFLVAGQYFSDESTPYLLVRMSAECATDIWTISDFDRRILEVFNKNAKFFPYSPPPVVLDDLKRSLGKLVPGETKRILKEVNYELENYRFILSIGTFDNPPSRNGAEKLLTFFEAGEFGGADRIVFIGRGSDNLSLEDSNKVIKLGYVSSHLMTALISHCSAIAIYQVPTTGWLTRLNILSGFGKKIYINAGYLSGKGYNIPNLTLYADQDAGKIDFE